MYRFLLVFLIFSIFACNKMPREIRVSRDDSKNFDLDGRHNFSPDDQWLVFDTRPQKGGIAACRTIEKINIETAEVKVLYRVNNPQIYGPGAGAASYHPFENRVIFIHGLDNCTEQRPYEFWRRSGLIVDEKQVDKPIFMDARDVTPPFTPGALRGGTHDHEWNADGQLIAFTYNDEIMKNLEDKSGEPWNMRTIGIAKKMNPVIVDHPKENDENIDGLWFSVLIVRVVPHPQPGSDEIDYAAGDGWIGKNGYTKADGSIQRARAFLGRVQSKNGKAVDEVFIVNIPPQIDIPGKYGPLEGTETSFPMPPKGTEQRRLTFTAETKYPGCAGPLHSSSDGTRIAYRQRDDNGIMQIYFISPVQSKPLQVTHHNSDVQSAVRWSPDGRKIYYVWDNSIIECNVQPGDSFAVFKRLTKKTPKPPLNIVLSHSGKVIAFNREIQAKEGNIPLKQIYKLDLNASLEKKTTGNM
jgi:hypothetical protein